MNMIEYFNSLKGRYPNYFGKKIKPNLELQKIYDSSSDIWTLLNSFYEYNARQEEGFLASGLSSYFNNQIDNQQCLSDIKLDIQDIDDAKFIARCFGKTISYCNRNVSLIYTSALGDTVINYAMQTFPAGIFEDVFQCSESHELPISPFMGEAEKNYFIRVMKYQIEMCKDFPVEKKGEVLFRTRRLVDKFCSGKNRIYLIPVKNILNNKISFGDILGLRGGEASIDEINQKLSYLPTLKDILAQLNTNYFDDANFTSEYGVAIYGSFNSVDITYLEVDRLFQIIQNKAYELGYPIGAEIPVNILYSEQKYSDIVSR